MSEYSGDVGKAADRAFSSPTNLAAYRLGRRVNSLGSASSSKSVASGRSRRSASVITTPDEADLFDQMSQATSVKVRNKKNKLSDVSPTSDIFRSAGAATSSLLQNFSLGSADAAKPNHLSHPASPSSQGSYFSTDYDQEENYFAPGGTLSIVSPGQVGDEERTFHWKKNESEEDELDLPGLEEKKTADSGEAKVSSSDDAHDGDAGASSSSSSNPLPTADPEESNEQVITSNAQQSEPKTESSINTKVEDQVEEPLVHLGTVDETKQIQENTPSSESAVFVETVGESHDSDDAPLCAEETTGDIVQGSAEEQQETAGVESEGETQDIESKKSGKHDDENDNASHGSNCQDKEATESSSSDEHQRDSIQEPAQEAQDNPQQLSAESDFLVHSSREAGTNDKEVDCSDGQNLAYDFLDSDKTPITRQVPTEVPLTDGGNDARSTDSQLGKMEKASQNVETENLISFIDMETENSTPENAHDKLSEVAKFSDASSLVDLLDPPSLSPNLSTRQTTLESAASYDNAAVAEISGTVAVDPCGIASGTLESIGSFVSDPCLTNNIAAGDDRDTMCSLVADPEQQDQIAEMVASLSRTLSAAGLSDYVEGDLRTDDEEFESLAKNAVAFLEARLDDDKCTIIIHPGDREVAQKLFPAGTRARFFDALWYRLSVAPAKPISSLDYLVRKCQEMGLDTEGDKNPIIAALTAGGHPLRFDVINTLDEMPETNKMSPQKPVETPDLIDTSSKISATGCICKVSADPAEKADSTPVEEDECMGTAELTKDNLAAVNVHRSATYSDKDSVRTLDDYPIPPVHLSASNTSAMATANEDVRGSTVDDNETIAMEPTKIDGSAQGGSMHGNDSTSQTIVSNSQAESTHTGGLRGNVDPIPSITGAHSRPLSEDAHSAPNTSSEQNTPAAPGAVPAVDYQVNNGKQSFDYAMNSHHSGTGHRSAGAGLGGFVGRSDLPTETNSFQHLEIKLREAIRHAEAAADPETKAQWENHIRDLNGKLRKNIEPVHGNSNYRDDHPPGIRQVQSTQNSGDYYSMDEHAPYTPERSSQQRSHIQAMEYESRMVDVIAPADLPGGYHFEAEIEGQRFLATVPAGGVQQGETFTCYMRELNSVAIDIPVGYWKDNMCHMCKHGLCHPTLWHGLFCPLISLGQVTHRLQLDFLGRPKYPGTEQRYTNRFMMLLVTLSWLGLNIGLIYAGNYKWMRAMDITASDWTAFALVNLCMYGFTVFVAQSTRSSIREKFMIREERCHDLEDVMCAATCLPCTVAQMARHTANYDHYEAVCCSKTGLPDGVKVKHTATMKDSGQFLV